jgi:hypothetical protein
MFAVTQEFQFFLLDAWHVFPLVLTIQPFGKISGPLVFARESQAFFLADVPQNFIVIFLKNDSVWGHVERFRVQSNAKRCRGKRW